METRGSTVLVTVDGVEHRISRSWISGFCRAQGGLPAKTTGDAARWWHEQWKRRQAAAAAPAEARS